MKTTVSRSIRGILKEFLSEQQARLSSKTYSGYEEAIYYFEEYLNGWAHPVKDYSEILNNFFIITGIKPGKLCLRVFRTEDTSDLGLFYAFYGIR